MLLDQLPDDILNKIYQDNCCYWNSQTNTKSNFFAFRHSCQNIKQACVSGQCQLRSIITDLQTNIIICQRHQTIVIKNFDFQCYFQIQYLVGLNIVIIQVFWTHQLLDYYYLWHIFYLIDQKITQLEYFWDYCQQLIIMIMNYFIFYYEKKTTFLKMLVLSNYYHKLISKT